MTGNGPLFPIGAKVRLRGCTFGEPGAGKSNYWTPRRTRREAGDGPNPHQMRPEPHQRACSVISGASRGCSILGFV